MSSGKKETQTQKLRRSQAKVLKEGHTLAYAVSKLNARQMVQFFDILQEDYKNSNMNKRVGGELFTCVRFLKEKTDIVFEVLS